LTGPQKPELVKKILTELKKYPEGVWIRKLARELDEPVSTIHKYMITKERGYPGEKVDIVKKLPADLGGNTIIRLKKCSG